MHVRGGPYIPQNVVVTISTGQDKQTERAQAEYIKEATAHVYTVDRYTGECATMAKIGQEVPELKYLEMVTFLTRGMLLCVTKTHR